MNNKVVAVNMAIISPNFEQTELRMINKPFGSVYIRRQDGTERHYRPNSERFALIHEIMRRSPNTVLEHSHVTDAVGMNTCIAITINFRMKDIQCHPDAKLRRSSFKAVTS